MEWPIAFSPKDRFRLVISKGDGIADGKINVEAYLMLNYEDKDDRVGKELIIAWTLVARYPFCPNAAPSVCAIS